MTHNSQSVDVDAVIVGAGFSGLRALHEMRTVGLSARVFEAAPDVGGTWYWNSYPGARTDSESWVYAFSFSKELLETWDWTERFPSQAETLAYLRHVAERFDMRRDITFDTKVVAAAYDEAANWWEVTTDAGEVVRCTYFLPALGILSAPYTPPFPGIDDFAGEWFVTGRWPAEGVDLASKRVAVIGTGSTAVQLIPLVAKVARHVTVFQRTPNYVLPARNHTLTEWDRAAIRRDYDDIWSLCAEQAQGMPIERAGRTLRGVPDPAERLRILERGWEAGGFRFIFETFDDIATDQECNEVVAEFIRDKIRAIVRDQRIAELLCPTDHPFSAKRPPLGHFYYEAYNRKNVELVDVSSTPITAITPNGVRVGNDDEYEVDVIVFATGFDAATGSFMAIDIRGRGNVELRERWADGPRTNLGISVDGFPNMFMICGPQIPFANLPVVMDGIVTWVGQAIRYMTANGVESMAATPDAVQAWGAALKQIVGSTVLAHGKNSWFIGSNIPGKPEVVLFYFGGVGRYRKACAAAVARDYEDFELRRAPAVAADASAVGS